DVSLDRADTESIAGVRIENAQAGPIVVGQRRIGHLRRRAHSRVPSGSGRKRKHHGAPHGGMAEAEGVAQLMGEDGCEVVRLRASAQSLKRREGCERVAWIE